MPDSKTKNANVARALLGKLYQVLTTKPEIEAKNLPHDAFISWCAPGLPFRKEDFMFATRGLSGDPMGDGSSGGGATVSEPSGSESSSSESSESGDGSGGPGSDTSSEASSGGSNSSGSTSGGSTSGDGGLSGGGRVRNRVRQAAEWSRLVNFIPNRNGIYDDEGQKKMFETNSYSAGGESMPFVYEQVLRNSQVPNQELSEENEKRLKRYRDKLTAEVEKENLATGETVEKTVSSDLVKAYNKYMQKYLDAELQYNSKRIGALTSDDEQVVLDWNLNQDAYRRKVQAAYDKWVSAGYKNEVEQMRSFINQVTMRNMVLMKRKLLDTIDRASITDQNSNTEFLWTTLIPSGLAFSDGWQEYTFSHTDVERHVDSSHNAWSAGGSAGGLFNVSAKAKGSKSESSLDFDLSDLEIKFEMAQGIIDRPWFSPEFMLSNAWRFPPNLEGLENMTQQLSDGQKPPNGSLIAYPTTAIFIRNVTVKFRDVNQNTEKVRSQLKASSSARIGFVRIGGASYEKGEYSSEFDYEVTKNGIRIPGMQVIGFRCRVMPKLPNPSEQVSSWQ